ncbi:hypothetical protein Bca52824_031048 [Brassica carinata]|uniref:Transcription factor IIIC subunit 5 HTH domain-containing protein n=1 Tax=Brassica carinata TaxID=52824 RepID=A0A8X7SAG8_BRACI|nr:hypothetical protein Bca52824_031048 [Brassica carinata]
MGLYIQIRNNLLHSFYCILFSKSTAVPHAYPSSHDSLWSYQEAPVNQKPPRPIQAASGCSIVWMDPDPHLHLRRRPALCADIVARVSESYCFDGMVDYQHVIPIHANVAQQRKRKWMEVKPLAGNDGLMDMADEDVMMLLPQFFAPKDMPDNLVLKLPGTLGPKKKDEAPTQNLCEVCDCYFSTNGGMIIPKVLNWEDFIDPSSDQWQWQVAVSALFDERPVWTRDSIVQRLLDKGLKCTHHMLKQVNKFYAFILRSAYYFSDGPFLRFWIKRGYDPRKDPESRVYQRMEFRVPPELRGYCDANASNKSKRRWEDICAFKVFPFKCQTFLQLFELEDEYIQREIRKPPKQTTCNYRTGWFSEALLDNLRLRVALMFVSVFPEPGFEDVFNLFKMSLRDGEELKKHKNTNKEKEVSADEDAEDVDDEYEELDVAAEDDDEISLSSHGCILQIIIF